VYCVGCNVVPCGRVDIPGNDTVKLFCPNCNDIYVPPSSRFQGVDGKQTSNHASTILLTQSNYRRILWYNLRAPLLPNLPRTLTSALLEGTLNGWVAPLPTHRYNQRIAAISLCQPQPPRGTETCCGLRVCTPYLRVQSQREGQERSEDALVEVET